jgi:VWFA-related protein
MVAVRYTRFVFVVLLLTLNGFSQQPTPTPQDELVRIKTSLAQTAVTVLDRAGRRVDNLRKEDFALLVDGRPVTIEFFENIAAGSKTDRTIRGGSATVGLPQVDRGRQPRTIVFFIDDNHLSLSGVNRTRSSLFEFIEQRMTPYDLVAISSPSGRLGFLQQFTNNKDVLRAAVERLRASTTVAIDYAGTPGTPLTEYNALSIERRDDPGLFAVYVENCMKSAPLGGDAKGRRNMQEHCRTEVRNRARQVLLQAGNITDSTYSSLESLLRTAARMRGSKLAFFVSDGFLTDPGVGGRVSGGRLARITKAAREAAVVVYSIDSKGLFSGALDATGAVPSDPNGRLASAEPRAVAASQDAMNALAVDTGGRALRNRGDFGRFMSEALDETSRYYLIAWTPDDEATVEKSSKIEIRIVGRPKLSVQAARKYTSNRPSSVSDPVVPNKSKGSGRDAELKQALAETVASSLLPMYLSLTYLDTPDNGAVLTSSVEVVDTALSYGPERKETGEVTLAGIILDANGKTAASFSTHLSVDPRESSQTSKVIYNYPVPLKPGIYQVRVAARDDRAATVGRADQWIQIPDLASRDLQLSSAFLGIQKVESRKQPTDRMQWSVDRRFALGSRLDFLLFIYNSTASADLSLRATIVKDGREIESVVFAKINADKGAGTQRIPFSGSLSLRNLTTGAYILKLTVEDRTAKKRISKEEFFFVE